MKSLLFPVLAGVLACTASTRAASIYTETFSTAGDTAGWFEVVDTLDSTLDQDPVSNVLTFSGNSTSLFYVAADSASSGGAFSGDYTAAGITGMTFTLSIQPGSSMNELLFELTNLTEGETWQYVLAIPESGLATDYSVPLTADGAGWTQASGDENFAFMLAHVEEVGFALSGSTAGNLAGTLDNVATVPEPATAALALLAAAGLFARRRR